MADQLAGAWPADHGTRSVLWDGACWEGEAVRSLRHRLLVEEPLRIEVEGHAYAVVMRTPGEEIAHAAGFCLAEGLVDAPEDLGGIEYWSESDGNVVAVSLTETRRRAVGSLPARKGFLSQTSCGICGKQMMKDLEAILRPVARAVTLSPREIHRCVQRLTQDQRLFHETHSSHAAMLFGAGSAPLAVSEDIGRHNALDKAIGTLFLQGRLEEVLVAVLSSRISYELVQKAGRAGVPVVIGFSRASSLAVELGAMLGMTLACAAAGRALEVYCGETRIRPDTWRRA